MGRTILTLEHETKAYFENERQDEGQSYTQTMNQILTDIIDGKYDCYEKEPKERWVVMSDTDYTKMAKRQAQTLGYSNLSELVNDIISDKIKSLHN